MRVSSLVLLLAVAILFAAVPDTSAKNFWSKVKDAVENTVEDVKNTAKGVARFAKKIGKCGGSCKKAMKGCHKLCFKSRRSFSSQECKRCVKSKSSGADCYGCVKKAL